MRMLGDVAKLHRNTSPSPSLHSLPPSLQSHLLPFEPVAHVQRDLGLVLAIGLELIGEDAGVGRDGGDIDGGDALRDLDVGGDRVGGHELEGRHAAGVRVEKGS